MEKLLNRNMTALSAFDSTVYPHEQVLSDVQSLNAAITALEQATPDTGATLANLSNVALTYNGLSFSHDVYAFDLTRRLPNYYRAVWGSEGHPIIYLDVIPECNAIAAGAWNQATVDSLMAKRNLDLRDLNCRLKAMANTLETATFFTALIK